MITGLAHVCFTVSDLESSIKYYSEKLGLKPAFDFVNEEGHRYGIYLHVGGRSFIELFEGDIAAPADKQSYKHICLEVDDIETTVAELRAKGVEVSPIKMGKDHSYQAWITDPDGNRMELHHYTPESWQAPHLE